LNGISAHDYFYLGILAAVVWSVRRDLKGLGIKIGKEQAKRRVLVATIVEATDDAEKRKMFTEYQRRED